MRSSLLALALLPLTGCLLDGRTGPDPTAEPRFFLTQFIDVLEGYSVRRDSVDWPALRSSVLATGTGATSYEATYPALSQALTLLGDNHSFVRVADGSYIDYAKTLTCSGATVASPTDIPADIGYVRVDAFSGTLAEQAVYTSAIQAAMEAADGGAVTGWIVDLRGNGGGNMWPMLAALGPFLQGRVGHFVDPDSIWDEWSVVAHRSYLGGILISEAADPYTPNATNGRIAVLIDGRVASSGEATAIAFRGRPDTRSFGTASCGLSTAISTGLIGPGITLGLATATMADRDRVIFGGIVAPDEVNADPVAVVARAIEWIRTGM